MHDLVIRNDNVPAYLVALDTLLLEVTIEASTMEVLFSRQIENSPQCAKVWDKYETDTQELTYDRSYLTLRKMVESKLAVEQRKKQRKIAQNRTSSGLAATGDDKHKGVCNSWKYKGACPRENKVCPFIHPPDQKGTGEKTMGKGR